MAQIMKSTIPHSSSRTFRPRSLSQIGGLVATLVCSALLALAGTAFSATPRGVFSIASIGKPIGQPVLDASYVDGVSLRQDWASLQPIDSDLTSDYNFSYLDGQIDRATMAGKLVLVRIGTMAGRPPWVDTAVRMGGGKFFTFLNGTVNTKIPVFWNQVFLDKKKRMITALGAHFVATNRPVTIVTASFANAVTEDWNVPHTQTPVDLVARWQALGYTTALMLDAGKQIIDATAAAFPNSWVTLAVGGNGPKLDGFGGDQVVARGAVNAARMEIPPVPLIAQKNDLKTCIPVAPGTDTLYSMIWDFQPDVGGQMVNTIYNHLAPSYVVSCGVNELPDTTITTCATLAVGPLGYGEKYIEIYEGDVTRYPIGCTNAHNLLLGQP